MLRTSLFLGLASTSLAAYCSPNTGVCEGNRQPGEYCNDAYQTCSADSECIDNVCTLKAPLLSDASMSGDGCTDDSQCYSTSIDSDILGVKNPDLGSIVQIPDAYCHLGKCQSYMREGDSCATYKCQPNLVCRDVATDGSIEPAWKYTRQKYMQFFPQVCIQANCWEHIMEKQVYSGWLSTIANKHPAVKEMMEDPNAQLTVFPIADVSFSKLKFQERQDSIYVNTEVKMNATELYHLAADDSMLEIHTANSGGGMQAKFGLDDYLQFTMHGLPEYREKFVGRAALYTGGYAPNCNWHGMILQEKWGDGPMDYGPYPIYPVEAGTHLDMAYSSSEAMVFAKRFHNMTEMLCGDALDELGYFDGFVELGGMSNGYQHSDQNAWDAMLMNEQYNNDKFTVFPLHESGLAKFPAISDLPGFLDNLNTLWDVGFHMANFSMPRQGTPTSLLTMSAYHLPSQRLRISTKDFEAGCTGEECRLSLNMYFNQYYLPTSSGAQIFMSAEAKNCYIYGIMNAELEELNYGNRYHREMYNPKPVRFWQPMDPKEPNVIGLWSGRTFTPYKNAAFIENPIDFTIEDGGGGFFYGDV